VNKLRILQVNKFYAPWVGGVERIAQIIAEGLNEKTDMQVMVCQPKGRASSDVVNKIRVFRASSFGMLFSMPISFSFIVNLWKKSKTADILQFHTPFPLGDLACLLSGFKGKVIVWWHSDIISQRILAKLVRPIIYAFLKRADMIIVATENHIKSSKILTNFASKCKVIPFGLKMEDFEYKGPPQFLTRRLKNSKNKKLLFVGRIVYYKGIDVLMESMKTIRGVELFIAGDGVMKDTYMDFTRNNGLEDKIHFLGYLSFEDLKAAYSDCDMFILPSINNVEAFGIVQLEAMYYGKPVINTSLKTGVPLVSVHNETGLTVPPGDARELAEAVQRLANDDALRLALGAKAAERVRQYFTVDKMLDALYGEYERMAGE
jgi:rhamnosyl/mannosyltransferase